jgi:hypothetical protein
MARTKGLLIVFCKCNAPAEAAAWSTWYDDTHLPDLLRGGDGPWVATRFELAEKPAPGMPGIGFSHVTLYEFEGDLLPRQVDAFTARDGDLRRAGRVHPNHSVIDAQLFRAHGRFSSKPEPSAALRGHILAFVMCNQPEREAEWDAWYDREHVPDMLASGAFAAASRWQCEPRRAHGPNHVTLYDVHHPSIQTAVDLSAGVMPGLTAAGRKHPCHTGAMALTLVGSGRHAGAGLRASESGGMAR